VNLQDARCNNKDIQCVVYIATIIYHIINEISLDNSCYVNNTLYSSPSDTRQDLMMAQCKGRNMLSQQ